jgi:O-antigen/teichoic acid export membrane protein
MAGSFFSIPPLIRALGIDRFGVLTLAWMVIGYFSFFDLGLGRALTLLVANRIGTDREGELPELIGTALMTLLVFGAIGGVMLILLAPWIVGHVLNVPAGLQSETIWAFRLMGLSVPMVTLTSALRGLVEAKRWFAQLNLVRIPLGLFTFFGPWLAVVVFPPGLVPVLVILLSGRLMGTFVHLWLARRAFPEMTVLWRLRDSTLKLLLHIGGWMTVTNVVGPIMVNIDRFVIGSMLSLTAVSFYATPYEMVTKLLIVGAAISGAIFPAFSAVKVQKDQQEIYHLYRRACVAIFLLLGPVVVAVIFGAGWGLERWISPEFSAQSATVLQILAVGVLLNAFASIPFSLIQGLGRPDLTAILHLLELPFYLIMLYGFIRLDGIRGAALAWTIRVTFDAVALSWMGRRLLLSERQ